MALIPEYRVEKPDRSHFVATVMRVGALIIGTLPLVGAVGVLLAWWLLSAGLVEDGVVEALCTGAAFFCIALVFLRSSYAGLRRAHPSAPRQMMPSERTVMRVLIASFAANVLAGFLVIYLRSQISVTVHNGAKTTITHFVVNSDAGSTDFGAISPGATVKRRLTWIGGPLHFSRTENGTTVNGDLAGTDRWSADRDAMNEIRNDGIELQIWTKTVDWR